MKKGVHNKQILHFTLNRFARQKLQDYQEVTSPTTL